jgi:hypothetical protein
VARSWQISTTSGRRKPLCMSEPKPNYEGFGVNGILMPNARWTVMTESDMQQLVGLPL